MPSTRLRCYPSDFYVTSFFSKVPVTKALGEFYWRAMAEGKDEKLIDLTSLEISYMYKLREQL